MKAPYQPHSDTSKAAAERAEPRMGAMHRKILAYLEAREPSGATDEEIARDLDMHPSTERPRRVELQQMGRCRDSTRRAKTDSGHEAVVWVACHLPPTGHPRDSRSRRFADLRKAAEPIVEQARRMLEHDLIVSRAGSDTLLLIPFRITPAQMRALIHASEA